MANLGNYQDPTGGQMAGDRDVIPPGDVIAAIAKSEEKDNKAGTGSYINLEFEVTDGQHKGRRFWVMLNLNNPNAQAVEIANRELNSICHACGKLRSNVQDTSELHGIPMRVRLGVRGGRDGYDRQNVVKSYKPLNDTSGFQSSRQSGGGHAQSGPWKQSA